MRYAVYKIDSLVIFIGIAEAFDTVSEEISLKQMENVGIRKFAIIWFCSYLKNIIICEQSATLLILVIKHRDLP